MPGFREVQYYLAGLWLLIRMDPAGFRFLDMSDRGVNRSVIFRGPCAPVSRAPPHPLAAILLFLGLVCFFP